MIERERERERMCVCVYGVMDICVCAKGTSQSRKYFV